MPLLHLLRRIVYFPFAVLAWLFRIRFVRISTPGRIGHLILEPDCYAKDRILQGRREVSVIAITAPEVANLAVLEHWRRHFVVVTQPLLVSLLRPFQSFSFTAPDLGVYAIAINETSRAFATYTRWGNRPPLLELTPAERAAGRETLARMGVPPDAWFVCVHSREGGYSPNDERWHSYRNSDIADYLPAMAAITAAGGWCIRMGDATMRPLPPSPRTIDYARSPEKSEAMDVFLAAECRFLLGNSSGLYILAAAFGRPCALANQAPMSNVHGLGVNDIAIPKRVMRDGSPLPLQQIFDSPAAHYRFTELYEKDGLELVNNSPEEILALAREMLEQVEGKATYTAADEARQATWLSLLRPGHYGYGASSRIGRDYLRKLDDPLFRSA